jgi:starch synthase
LFETHAFVFALCVQVAKRKEPLQPKQDTAPRFAKQNGALPGVENRNGALPGVANQNGVLSGVANQNGALSGGENKSIVLATPQSIVKLLPALRSDVILPSGDTDPGTIAPTTTQAPPPPSPALNFLSPPYAPELDTVGNVELTEKNIVEPEAPFPPSPSVQEATWNFKKYIGFDEPAEENNDAWAAVDGVDSNQGDDSGPLAGENVMNVIMVAAECSPWCKTGTDTIVSDFGLCCCSFQFA